MCPLFDAGAVDRLANLFGTRGAHRPVVFEEAQAALLERQSAVVEQASHFTLGVFDKVFMDHAMHAAWQHAVEMRHQLDVVAVITADVFEAVAETLAAREMLLEIREATGERVPPCIDDPRVRQREMDQAEMREIVRHLVAEEWQINIALQPRYRKIPVAKLAHPIIRSLRQR